MDLAPDLPHLASKVLLHVFSPDETTWAVFVRAFIEALQLLAPFPNQRVEPHQLGLELSCFWLFVIHYHELKALY